jgi:hypothetical protein
MSFIRFTKFVINPVWIQSVEMMPTSYKIIMSQPVTDGYFIWAFGNINTINMPLWINKEKEPDDYEKMTKWMEKNAS